MLKTSNFFFVALGLVTTRRVNIPPCRVSDLGISSAHQAVAADNIHCLSTLVRSGASVDSPDKRGLLPVDVAKVIVYFQNVTFLKFLFLYSAVSA